MSEKSAGASTKKRKYFDRGGGGKNKKWRRPKRGAPGVLLTCETGRERRCEREGLEILNYYHCENVGEDEGDRPSSNSSSSKEIDDNDGKEKKDEENNSSLTLEEELKLLKSQGGNLESSAFAEYDTSCRGTVFILCTLPNCDLIPTIQTQYTQSNNNNNNNIKSESENTKSESESTNQCTSKNNISTNSVSVGNVIVTEEVKQDKTCNGPNYEKNIDETSAIASSEVQNKNDNNVSSSSSPLPSPWDPISTVRGIMADIDNDTNKAVPRSRFVTRIIPIQATCFASPEELTLTTKEVLNRYLSRTTKTFAITFKRRHCTKIDRNTVIKIVGDAVIQVVPKCTVNLDNPDATILVEICNNLVGISVIENLKKYRNFNLTEAAAATTSGKNEEKTKK
jgi:tRNA acetyltransferase TAN1